MFKKMLGVLEKTHAVHKTGMVYLNRCGAGFKRHKRVKKMRNVFKKMQGEIKKILGVIKSTQTCLRRRRVYFKRRRVYFKRREP